MVQTIAVEIILDSAVCAVSFSSKTQWQKPNSFWVTCEDISPYIGAYGNALVKTPNFDQLANEGIRYTNAYTTAGVCAPSRAATLLPVCIKPPLVHSTCVH